MSEGKILESTVLFCDSSMRLHIDLGDICGIMEKSEAVFCRPGESVKDIAVITRVGKPIAFKVIGFRRETGGKTVALLSRREAQRECNDVFLSSLLAGDVIPAKVTPRFLQSTAYRYRASHIHATECQWERAYTSW